MSADDRTLDLLRRLVDSSPDDFAARSHLAGLLLDAGRAIEALGLLEAAPSRPSTVEADLLLGRALEGVDAARAIAHYRDLLTRDRRCAPAHMALARLFRAQGSKEDAGRHYGIAVVLEPAFEDAAFDDWLHGGPSAEPSPAAGAPPAARVPVSAQEGPRGGRGEPKEEDDDDDVPSAEELDEALEAGDRAGPAVPKVTFADVGGMDEIKEQVRMRVVYPFKNPALFQKFQRRPGGGILLYGPPGCGKTHLARATAGECEARFVSIGIADVLSKWLGESEHRIREVFENARRRAPTILFIDELDALGMDRREIRGAGLQTTINQMLTEMDGIGAANSGVLVLAATNAPWSVDPAFRRPGRFDRVIFVPPPDVAAREAILRLHLEGVPHDVGDFKKLAESAKNFSGADLRHVVESAADAAIREEMRTGRAVRITDKMLKKALGDAKATTLEWLDTARRYASYSNRSGQYDDVARFFEQDA